MLERSRSGDGAHVWVFFSGLIPAASARRIGVYLLREAMTVRAELDLVSYDRLFPAEDFMPKGSFGNLIALPLQGECRKRGTTVFLYPFDPRTLRGSMGIPRVARPCQTRRRTGDGRRLRRTGHGPRRCPPSDEHRKQLRAPNRRRRSERKPARCSRSTGSVSHQRSWRP